MSDKQLILEKIEIAKSEIPNKMLPDLQVNEISGNPEMHPFEYKIWTLGEEIRPLLVNKPQLRNDSEIQNGILEICLEQKAKRGRESFVMLMGNVNFSKYAPEIASLIKDHYISGHVIDTLVKMKQSGFSEEIAPYMKSKTTWVREAAKKYCEKYGGL